MFSCNLPPALLAEWPGYFTCYCSNTGVEWIPKCGMLVTGGLTLMCYNMFVVGCLTLTCNDMFVAGCSTLTYNDMFVAGCLTFHRQRSTQKTWMPSSVEKSQCHTFFLFLPWMFDYHSLCIEYPLCFTLFANTGINAIICSPFWPSWGLVVLDFQGLVCLHGPGVSQPSQSVTDSSTNS